MKKNHHGSVISIVVSKPFIGLMLLFITVSLLNIPVLTTLWRHGFDDGTYSHAYLIPFISLYLYFLIAQANLLQFRHKLAIIPTICFITSCYLLFVTTNAQISIGYWGALLAVFITSVTMLYRFNWYIVFPAAFLVFIFPFWGILVPLLQNISIAAVTYMMSFTGVPTFVEGNFVTIPAGVFEIADGCSGLRYMIVSLAIGCLFIFLNIRNTKRALLFLSVTIIGALVTNWLRITALILIGDYTNMESSLMDDHNTFGWYLFIPFMVMLFWWGNKIADIDFTSELPQTTQVLHSPSQLSLVILVAILGLSSTSFSTMLIPSPSTDSLTSDADFEVKPFIAFYAFVTGKVSLESNTTELTYFFNGKELDGKPSYYENNLIPTAWNVVSEEINQQWRVIVVSNRKNNAIIRTRYEVDEQFILLNKKLKFARLISGTKNIKKSKLHWSFSSCKSDCKDELVNL